MRTIVGAFVMACSVGATGQQLTFGPAPLYGGQRVAFHAGITSCPLAPVITGVSRAGSVVTATYTFASPGGIGCFAASAPSYVQGDLGMFEAGTYELRLEGSYQGFARTPIVGTFTVLPPPAVRPLAKLEILEGDRRVELGLFTFDVVVRAIDANGVPVAGAGIIAYSTWFFGAPVRVDEFGIAGFGRLFQSPVLSATPDQVSTTGADGIARIAVKVPTGGTVIGIGAWPEPGRAVQAFANVVALDRTPPGSALVAAVEFHHDGLGRYVLAVNDDEIAALDRGAFAGWSRSTGAIAVWPTRDTAPPGAVPVCRFFSPVHTAHFLTSNPVECDGLAARWPGVWVLESREAFWAVPPEARTGACPDDLQPVYRMYRASPGPAHRYVTNRWVMRAMAAAGWVHEGPDDDRGAMCVPR
jgi:hypothetical protein